MRGLYTTDEWDANYTNKVNVRITGMTSGERVYAHIGKAPPGNPMVLKKSQPFIGQKSLATNVLSEGVDQEVAKWDVAADAAGPIAFRQGGFRYTKTPGMSVDGFTIHRSPVDLAQGAAFIWACDDVQMSCSNKLLANYTKGVLWVIFMQDEVIQGAGNTYAIRVKAANVGGQTLTFELVTKEPGDDPLPRTGHFTWNGWPFPVLASLGLDPKAWPTAPLAGASRYWIWADISAVPHSGLYHLDGPDYGLSLDDDYSNGPFLSVYLGYWMLTGP